MDMVKSMISHFDLYVLLWSESLNTATKLLKKVTLIVVPTILYETWVG